MAKLEDIYKSYGNVSYLDNVTDITYNFLLKIEENGKYKVPAFKSNKLIGYAIMEKEN